MFKPVAQILVIIVLILFLAGCSLNPAAPTTTPTTTPTSVPTTVPAATDSPEEESLPQASTSAATEDPITKESEESAATQAAESEVPYLLKIEADHSVYQGPGYDYSLADIIRETGVYTIVEETVDYEGILWGKLKSGIGWVDLTEMQSAHYKNALLRANYAGDNLLLHGAYHYYPGNESEYCIPIVFRSHGHLRNVALFDMQFSGEDYLPGTDLYTLSEMTEELPLVAELAFPGDMSMYGIRFVDEEDVPHTYIVYVSGRNGTLVLEEQ